MAASLASAIPTKSKNVEMISGSTLYSSSGNQNWFKKKKRRIYGFDSSTWKWLNTVLMCLNVSASQVANILMWAEKL